MKKKFVQGDQPGSYLHLQAVVASQEMDGSRPALLRMVPKQDIGSCTAHHSAQAQHTDWRALCQRKRAPMLGGPMQQAQVCTAAPPESGVHMAHELKGGR